VTTVIELDGVTAGYGTIPSVRELTLHVGEGEVVALLGANGAGKSTVIRSVCGLERVKSGSIEVLGRDVAKATPRTRARIGLGTVAGDRGVFTQLTVAENLRVGAERGGTRLALDSWFPGLVPLLDRRAGLLSGGEQTMLALARALIRRPRALVVDELSTGLAPVLAKELLARLRQGAAEWGTGVLVAEQSAGLALEAADRVCLLRRGEVVFDGPPGALRDRRGFLESTYLGEMD
jgi:branched-chain amino acid transport system ATP-binding protein